MTDHPGWYRETAREFGATATQPEWYLRRLRKAQSFETCVVCTKPLFGALLSHRLIACVRWGHELANNEITRRWIAGESQSTKTTRIGGTVSGRPFDVARVDARYTSKSNQTLSRDTVGCEPFHALRSGMFPPTDLFEGERCGD